MAKACYELKPRDLLFFRDGRPMDADKRMRDNVRSIGHGANWPRPDILFSAVIHHLIKDSDWAKGDFAAYGSVTDLQVVGPFPQKGDGLYLPTPLDWDMTLFRLSDGRTNLPVPLGCGFCDRTLGKKKLPGWIASSEYSRYLCGSVGGGKDEKTSDDPKRPDGELFVVESRIGTTLDAVTGASKRVSGKESGQYQADYLRLGEDVSMICEISCDTKPLDLDSQDVRMGGQGGLVRFEKCEGESILARFGNLPKGEKTRYVRWTLIAPALFSRGWYPNWLDDGGKVMIPQNEVLRHPHERREEFRQRKLSESKFFESARIVAARIGDAVAFSGYDTKDGAKPTELAVPAGSCYVFECKDPAEAEKLVEALNLKNLSDLGEKGFGLGICSYIKEPQKLQQEKPEEPAAGQN